MKRMAMGNFFFISEGSSLLPPARFEEINALISEIQVIENDRGAALIGAAFLDCILADLLKNYFIDEPEEANQLLGAGCAMESFYVKILLAYCLGLLRKEVAGDLQRIRRIRNLFAHGHDKLSFEDAKISGIANELTSYSQIAHDAEPRSKFNITIIMIAHQLVFSMITIGHKKLDSENEDLGPVGTAEEISACAIKIADGNYCVPVHEATLATYLQIGVAPRKILESALHEGFEFTYKEFSRKTLVDACRFTKINSIARLDREFVKLLPISGLFYRVLKEEGVAKNLCAQLRESDPLYNILIAARWKKLHPWISQIMRESAKPQYELIEAARQIFYDAD